MDFAAAIMKFTGRGNDGFHDPRSCQGEEALQGWVRGALACDQLIFDLTND
jgi:hypothetical protein